MPRAVILGLSGSDLTPREAAFFADVDPWGFILFARNIVDPEQVRALTAALRRAVGREAPILVDQEGGRVQRLGPPHWRDWPPVRDVCDAATDETALMTTLRMRYRMIADELIGVGIDVDCAPVLDVPQPNAHPIIGDRAFGRTPSEVAARAREAAAGLLDGGVLPVLKHLPGHGRAPNDSHETLPVVRASIDELRNADFPPFLSNRDLPLGMTAHVVYSAIDPDACATLSPTCIRLIREEIGFEGVLMTDDLSMKALDGPMATRAERALDAGCDLILHCNGEMDEMNEMVRVIPELAGRAGERCARALSHRPSRTAFPTARMRHG